MCLMCHSRLDAHWDKHLMYLHRSRLTSTTRLSFTFFTSDSSMREENVGGPRRRCMVNEGRWLHMISDSNQSEHVNQLIMVIAPDVTHYHTVIHIISHKLECTPIIYPLLDGGLMMLAESIHYLQELLVANGDPKVIESGQHLDTCT